MRTNLQFKNCYPHVQFIITLVEKPTFINDRAMCCGLYSWNLHGRYDDDYLSDMLKLIGCFCYHVGDCAEYNVTSSKFL